MKTETTTITNDKAEKTPLGRYSGFKSALHLLGSLAFAHSLILTIHEFGHAIAYKIVGLKVVKIKLHPFDLSQVISDSINVNDYPFAASMGPLTNIIVATIVFLVLWKFRKPILLPLLLWGPMAFLEEGVGIIIDVVDYPFALGDWGVVVYSGVPLALIAILGVLFILVGSFTILLVFPLINEAPTDPFIKRLTINIGGFVGFYLLSFLFVIVFNDSLVASRGIALGACAGLVLLVTILQRPLSTILDKISHTEPSEIPWSFVGVSLGLAVTIITIQMLTFYLV